MSNFIPNEIKRFVSRDPPWMTKPLKTLFDRKNRLFKNYKKHGYKIEGKHRIETAKVTYLATLGKQVNDPNTS